MGGRGGTVRAAVGIWVGGETVLLERGGWPLWDEALKDEVYSCYGG